MAGPGDDETQPVDVRDATPRPETEYAEPVDPWATAEAAAIAAGDYAPHPGHGLGPTAQEPPRRGRARTFLLAGGAAAVVVAVAAAAALIFWPGHPALDYHPLEEVRRIAPLAPLTSGFADTEVLGDRAYLAGVTDAGILHVVAADAGSGRVFWESDFAGRASSWKSMHALPSAVVLFSGTDSATGTSRVVVLDAIHDGKVLWEKQLGAYDDMYLSPKIMLWVNRETDRLIGLGTADGEEKWAHDDPDTSAIHLVTTPGDLDGPAGPDGRVLAPEPGDEQRFVQIDSDRTATVRDLATGRALQQRPDVAGTSDKVVAHDGRLYVLEPGTTKRIFSYDLGGLAESQPVTLHTAQSGDDIRSLTPCGELLCFVLTRGYDRATDLVKAVGGEGAWEKTQPEVENLVPVGGNALLAVGDEGTTLLVDGEQAWYRLGVSVRLDAGNVLTFSGGLSGSVDDRQLSAVHVGDEPVDLGVLEDVRSDTCSWNTSVVTCATRTDYVIASFAG